MLGTAQPNRLYRGRAFACPLNAAEPILDVIAETRRNMIWPDKALVCFFMSGCHLVADYTARLT